MPSPFKPIEPLTRIGTVAAGTICGIELPILRRISSILLEVTVTKLSVTGVTKLVPTIADACGLIQFKIGSSAQRSRLASELFGATGLNAMVDANAAGHVLYAQSGVSTLSKLPVLIGSAADTAQQALLGVSTTNAITATFYLPINFAEPFRKEYAMSEMMALITGFDDKTTVGQVALELTLPAAAQASLPGATAFTATLSAPGVKAAIEYDNLVAKKGALIQLSKEYRFPVQYTAAGDIEVAQQIRNTGGLQRVSLLTSDTIGDGTGTYDRITRVVVKQGSLLLRDVTAERNIVFLAKSDFNPAANYPGRFDIEFDLNDDPMSAVALDPSQPLSIVATLSAAGAANKTIMVLVSSYGLID
jgi:hypothetical protein